MDIFRAGNLDSLIQPWGSPRQVFPDQAFRDADMLGKGVRTAEAGVAGLEGVRRERYGAARDADRTDRFR